MHVGNLLLPEGTSPKTGLMARVKEQLPSKNLNVFCLLREKKGRQLIINVNSGHSIPSLFKGKSVKRKESLEQIIHYMLKSLRNRGA